MELNIEQSEYLGQFIEEAGIKIAISNSGEMPFPLEQGLSVSPGFATSIGLRKVRLAKDQSPQTCKAQMLISPNEILMHSAPNTCTPLLRIDVREARGRGERGELLSNKRGQGCLL